MSLDAELLSSASSHFFFRLHNIATILKADGAKETVAANEVADTEAEAEEELLLLLLAKGGGGGV